MVIKNRRPKQKFTEMGIPINSTIIHRKTGDVATIISDDKVLFRGEKMSLQKATIAIDKKRTHNWIYNGVLLSTIYNYSYPYIEVPKDEFLNLIALQNKMKNLTPEKKEKISHTIERGIIANKIKKITEYKCLICDTLNMNPLSFIKKDGEYYIETHHVENVSTLKKGTLSIDNLMTVCANHHRQIHYGRCELVEQNEQSFTFKIDKQNVIVQKIIIKSS